MRLALRASLEQLTFRCAESDQTGQTTEVSFDQYAPYGPVVESSLRVVTWNVWGGYGPWREREAAIEDSLVATNQDIVCLVESWSSAETTQAALVAERLGVEHHAFAGD